MRWTVDCVGFGFTSSIIVSVSISVSIDLSSSFAIAGVRNSSRVACGAVMVCDGGIAGWAMSVCFPLS